VTPEELAVRLRKAGLPGVGIDARRRAEYSSDASNYRVVPSAVAFPMSTDEIIAALEVCRELGVPLTGRGAGTSIAGNALSADLVLDTGACATAKCHCDHAFHHHVCGLAPSSRHDRLCPVPCACDFL
jgi:hypothetical protein